MFWYFLTLCKFPQHIIELFCRLIVLRVVWQASVWLHLRRWASRLCIHLHFTQPHVRTRNRRVQSSLCTGVLPPSYGWCRGNQCRHNPRVRPSTPSSLFVFSDFPVSAACSAISSLRSPCSGAHGPHRQYSSPSCACQNNGSSSHIQSAYFTGASLY